MRHIALATMVALLLAGCAAAPHWTKPDMSGLDRDDYECRRENTATGAVATTIGASVFTSPATEVNTGLYRRCMQARGYRDRNN